MCIRKGSLSEEALRKTEKPQRPYKFLPHLNIHVERRPMRRMVVDQSIQHAIILRLVSQTGQVVTCPGRVHSSQTPTA